MDTQRTERNRLLHLLLDGLQSERVLVADDIAGAAHALLAKALSEMEPHQCEVLLSTVESSLRDAVANLRGRNWDRGH